MSFGFPGGSTDLASLAEKIEAAHKADIILLAAASNAGGNGRRAYPASESYVICVHAVDGRGNNCGGFNPSAVDNEDNFATLGIGIKCMWDEEPCYRSGTSYATPIAAGFAANALEYAMYHKKKGNLHPTIYSRLRKPSGMQRMFRLMADEREKRSGYQWIRPWKFWLENGKDSWICENLKQALGLEKIMRITVLSIYSTNAMIQIACLIIARSRSSGSARLTNVYILKVCFIDMYMYYDNIATPRVTPNHKMARVHRRPPFFLQSGKCVSTSQSCSVFLAFKIAFAPQRICRNMPRV